MKHTFFCKIAACMVMAVALMFPTHTYAQDLDGVLGGSPATGKDGVFRGSGALMFPLSENALDVTDGVYLIPQQLTQGDDMQGGRTGRLTVGTDYYLANDPGGKAVLTLPQDFLSTLKNGIYKANIFFNYDMLTVEFRVETSMEGLVEQVRPTVFEGNLLPVAHNTYGVTASSLNIRSGRGADNAVIGKLYKNDRVQVLSMEDGWAQIALGVDTGYVSSTYLLAQ